jgi:drug/metabolite transporter (DMT)-like permease
MSGHRKAKVLALWLVLLTSDTSAQVLLKIGAVRTMASGWKPNYLVVCGYSLYIVSFVAWMQILRFTRLSIALTSSSLLYITVPLASWLLLGEGLPPKVIAGSALITLGVFLLGINKKEEA